MVETLMIESNKTSDTEIQKIHNETNSPLPWCELLVKSEISVSPSVTTECNDSNTKVIGKDAGKDKLRSFGRLQRRTLSGLSFKSDAGPLLSRYRQTRFSSRRVRKRVVFKHGDCNVVQGNVAKRRRRYLQDIFTTLVDAQWRWTLLVFSMNFMLSWLGFAVVWWVIVYSHGDLDSRNYSINKTFTPCVEDIHGFTSCFLFSVETQHTIGYGSKHTTEECPEAIFVMCIQSMTGVILQAFMVGIVFAKLSRPKKRTQTLLFSRNAVICQRDGQPCLMFRVGDMRKSHIIEAHIRAQMIKRKVTREGELLPFFQTELKVGGDGEEDKIFFIWPTTIVHKIDHNSPLYHLSASDMLRERFEIIVMLEGVIESTGMTTQARSSYLPAEILWGHRFEHIITFRKETGEYEVNYTLFNNTYEVDTPLCSAAQLDELKPLHHAKGERMSSSAFPTYRDNSSTSLTTSSGSSLASSAGGLHMHAPTPPTPIPVMITAPDDSSRRESINTPVDLEIATFYTPEEGPAELDTDNIPKNIDDYSSYHHGDYNKIPSCVPLKDGTRTQIPENSKYNFPSRGCDSKPNIDQITISPEISSTIDHQNATGALKKSASKVTLDSRHTRFADSPPKLTQDNTIVNMSRLEINTCADSNDKLIIHRVTTTADKEKDTDGPIELTKMNHLLRITPPPRLPPSRTETSDTKSNNHYPLNASPREQV